MLLNQNIISGIGNIYANEILFDAKISPFIPCKYLNLEDIKKIIFSSKKILEKSINLGGTSLKNYISADGVLGNFQNEFKVYNKEGKKILNSKIYRIRQAGRSTFYCPNIQKSKFNIKNNKKIK